VTLLEFETKCRDLCPHCAAGEHVRQRTDTSEWVHDWSFGGMDPKIGRRTGIGHGICLAHDLRLKQKDLVDG
jgi:hypothetical protein